MAHIDLGNEIPGIRGLLAFRPEMAGPLMALAETLLRGDNTLTRGERELIASYVSKLNDCTFCASSHGATAAAQLDAGMPLVEAVHADSESAPVSERIRALLAIAAAVRVSGREVRPELVSRARTAGATDTEIHDTVLIAAAFAMFNRYVDGLGALTPTDPARYAAVAQRIKSDGYTRLAPEAAYTEATPAGPTGQAGPPGPSGPSGPGGTDDPERNL